MVLECLATSVFCSNSVAAPQHRIHGLERLGGGLLQRPGSPPTLQEVGEDMKVDDWPQSLLLLGFLSAEALLKAPVEQIVKVFQSQPCAVPQVGLGRFQDLVVVVVEPDQEGVHFDGDSDMLPVEKQQIMTE